MPFREKTAWIALVTTTAVWGTYFFHLGRALAEGSVEAEVFGALAIRAVVAIIILQIILQALAAARAPRDAHSPADERERHIDLKSTSVAFVVLASGVMLVAAYGLALAGGAPFEVMRLEGVDGLLLLSNGVLLAVVAAELVRNAGQIALYRFGT